MCGAVGGGCGWGFGSRLWVGALGRGMGYSLTDFLPATVRLIDKS